MILEDESGECKNGHPIVNREGHVILLIGNVVRCNRCGNMFLIEKLPVVYIRDEFTQTGSRVHIYRYLKPVSCMSCGSIVVTHVLECLSSEYGKDEYKKMKGKLMPGGFVRN